VPISPACWAGPRAERIFSAISFHSPPACWTASSSSTSGQQTALARIDTESGARQDFSFGPEFYIGEPVVAPDPDAPLAEDRGWVLSEVLDGKAGKSFLAVFDAGHVEDGPVAKLKLHEHLPMSFHGWWEPA
jgi:all-trans-8'-apo-beta-carotenal 15,15'-oxygenase